MVACLETFFASLPQTEMVLSRRHFASLWGNNIRQSSSIITPRLSSSFLSLPYRAPIRNFRVRKQSGVVVRQSLPLLLAFRFQAAGFDMLASTIR